VADYKAMYLKLFNAMSETIESLQKYQQEVEELYLSMEELTATVSRIADEGGLEKGAPCP